MDEKLCRTEFRKELKKIMPGYKWTVHRDRPVFCGDFLKATGIISSGKNRVSTLQVIKQRIKGKIEYEVQSAGFGLKAPWLSEYTDSTLPRALRGLQNHYEEVAANYSRHALDLQGGRA